MLLFVVLLDGQGILLLEPSIAGAPVDPFDERRAVGGCRRSVVLQRHVLIGDPVQKEEQMDPIELMRRQLQELQAAARPELVKKLKGRLRRCSSDEWPACRG